MASVLLVVILIIVLAVGGFYFFSKQNQELATGFNDAQPETTSATTTTSSASSQTNFLRRKFYVNVSSGIGLTWFGNSTIKDVKDGIYVWQYATNNYIQFNEVNDSKADITISFVSGLNQTPTTKTIGETYSKEGLIKGSIQIVPQGVPCRNTGIIMHEVGHIIGLDHNQTNRFDIMYPLQSFGCDQNISSYDASEAKRFIEELIS